MDNLFEIKTVITDSFEMDYIVFGNGKKSFVILPGLSIKGVLGSAGGIASAFKDFTDEYTVYVFDGKKDIKQGYTLKNMADDTACAMKKIGIENADIFGTSMGGMITQLIAIKYPEIVNKIVLCSTASRLCDYSYSLMKEWNSLMKNGSFDELKESMFSKIYSEKFYEKYKRILLSSVEIITESEAERFIALTSSCPDLSVYSDLDKIKCPAFVIGAGNDDVLTGNASVEIAEKLNCQIYMYPDGSHAAYDEEPDYRARVLKFLSE